MTRKRPPATRKPGAQPGNRNNPAGRPREDFRAFMEAGFARFVARQEELQELDLLSDRGLQRLKELKLMQDSDEFLLDAVTSAIERGSDQVIRTVMERRFAKPKLQTVYLSRPDMGRPDETAKRLAKMMLEGKTDPSAIKTAVETLRAIGEIQRDAAFTRALEMEAKLLEGEIDGDSAAD